MSDTWTHDLLVVVTPSVAPGFRLAGTRTAVARDADQARAVVERELDGGRAGVIAVHAWLWSQLPAQVRAGWEGTARPLVLSLPDESAPTGAARRDRMRELLARSIGYEITFLPEGGS